MTITTSGQISLSDLASEFGDPYPISLSDYYRQGIYVDEIPENAAVPLQGSGSLITFSDFYGTKNSPVINISFVGTRVVGSSVNINNIPGYLAGVSIININIMALQYLYSTSTSIPALSITGGAPGDIITLNNLGAILGRGGDGEGILDPYAQSPATSGGIGLYLSLGTSIKINSTGYICGGGGGGGIGLEYIDVTGAGGGGGAGMGQGGPATTTPATGGDPIGSDGISLFTANTQGRGGGTGGSGASRKGSGGGAGGLAPLGLGGVTLLGRGGAGGNINAIGNDAGIPVGDAGAAGGGGGWGASGGSGQNVTTKTGSAWSVTPGAAGGPAIDNSNSVTINWIPSFPSSLVFGVIV